MKLFIVKMQGTHEVAGLLRGRGARVGEGHLGGVLVVVVRALGGHRGSAPAARGAVRRAESERNKMKFVNFCAFFLLRVFFLKRLHPLRVPNLEPVTHPRQFWFRKCPI